MAAEADPRALEKRAFKDYRDGDLNAAEAGFRTAQAAYTATGNDSKAAEMANNLCVVLVGLGRPQEALKAIEGTDQVFASAGDRLNAARTIGNRASALEAAGRLDEAADEYQGAIERFRAAGAAAEESSTWQALSKLHMRRGDAISAASAAQAALDTHPSPGPLRRLVRGFVDKALALLMR
jgi:tetratricopeptide (TPR) repeat protein